MEIQVLGGHSGFLGSPLNDGETVCWVPDLPGQM